MNSDYELKFSEYSWVKQLFIVIHTLKNVVHLRILFKYRAISGLYQA